MLLWPWNQQKTLNNHWIISSKLRFRRRHQEEHLWCGPDHGKRQSGQHEKMIRLCKGSGEEHNSKCPWLRLGKNVLKNWRRAGPLSAQVRLSPLSTSAWGPWNQLDTELRAPASPMLQGGDPGQVCWGDSGSVPPASHPPLPGTGALPFACSPASTWPEHKALLLSWFAQQSLWSTTHMLALLLVHYISFLGLRCSC